jgi:hypothetical protein
MTFAYLGSLNMQQAAELGFSTITIAKSGDPTFSITLTDVTFPTADATGTCTIFNHHTTGLGSCVGEDRGESALMATSYSSWSLGGVVQVALAVAADGVAVTPAVSTVFDPDTLTYTFGGTGSTTVTFGSEETAWLFGFSSTVLSGASSHVSDITPWGVIVPVLSDVSEPTPNYEPESIAIQAVSAGNAVVGLQRSSVPLYRDWIQQYETKAKTLRLQADSSHPFTHQELFETHRTSLPFVVTSGFAESLNEVFFLRADGSAWKAERATTANDTQFHIQYKTIVAGRLSGGG